MLVVVFLGWGREGKRRKSYPSILSFYFFFFLFLLPAKAKNAMYEAVYLKVMLGRVNTMKLLMTDAY